MVISNTHLMLAALLLCSSGALKAQPLSSDSQGVAQAADDRSEGVTAEGFNLSLKTNKDSYKAGEVSDLSILLEDVSQPRWQTVSADHLTYTLEAIRPDGTPAPLTAEGQNYLNSLGQGGSESRLVFTPGVKEGIPLTHTNAFYDMTQPGEYSLQVSREVPSLKDPKKMVTIYSNVVKITIVAAQEDEDAPKD